MTRPTGQHSQTTQSEPAPTAGDTIAGLTRLAVAVTGIFFFGLLLGWLIYDNRPASLQLHFNPYALLSAISLLSNLVAFGLIIRVKKRTDAVMWFSVFLFSLSSWAAAETMVRLSATPGAALFWGPITTLGSVIMPLALYMFAHSYTDNKRTLNPLVFPVLAGVSMLLIFADSTSGIITDYRPSSIHYLPWGYVNETGPGYFILAIWIILLSAAAFMQLHRFRKRTIDPVVRQQTLLFMIGIAVPLAIGSLTDGILPSIHDKSVPPLTVMLVTIMGIIISYGILKHRFLNFTPGAIGGQILETMNEAVFALQADLRISYVNRGAERLLGMSAAEFTDCSLHDFLAAHWTKAHLRHRIFDKLANRNFYTLDSLDFKRADGTIITTKLSVSKIADEDLQGGYIVVLTDITAIAQTQAIIEHQVSEQTRTIKEARSMLTSSINSLEFGFVLVDKKPEVTLVNQAAHQLFCGNKDHDSTHCTIATVANIQGQLGEKVPIIDSITKCIETQHTQDIHSVDYINSRTLRIFISPVIDGDATIGAAILFQDITEEQVLARSRDEFFSIASHELRTPLTAIKGNASLIQSYYPKVLKDPALAELVDDIHESSDRLIAIVNDFLDMSRLEQGRLSYVLEAVNITEIVEKIIYELAANSKEKGLYLRLGRGLKNANKLPPAIADRSRLKQVLYNLIGNSLKFTDKGGVTIDAHKDDTNLLITVTDTGHGIDKKMQLLLFRKFQQANESLLTRDSSRGTGLGLYISRLLMGGMGGSLDLAESSEKGSTFTITLPLATEKRLRELPNQTVQATDTASGLTVGKTAPAAHK